jgi:hypothetical protein
LSIIKKLGNDSEKLNSLDLSLLTSIQDALPKSLLSTEQTLRSENRIQDNTAILAKLGFKGELPLIPAELLEECVRTSGTLVLKFKTTVLDYQANLNHALGSDKERLHLYVFDRAESLAKTNEVPCWINVPNTVRDDTLGMSKATALNHVPGSATCDPMDTILMLGYNNLQTGERLAGFTDKFTFTNQENTLVGTYKSHGINVLIPDLCDADGEYYVGLAPRLAPESEI